MNKNNSVSFSKKATLNAWNYLLAHPLFNVETEQVINFDPSNDIIDTGLKKGDIYKSSHSVLQRGITFGIDDEGGKFGVWLECSIAKQNEDDKSKFTLMHDMALDVYGDSVEDCIIKLEKAVRENYGDKGLE